MFVESLFTVPNLFVLHFYDIQDSVDYCNPIGISITRQREASTRCKLIDNKPLQATRTRTKDRKIRQNEPFESVIQIVTKVPTCLFKLVPKYVLRQPPHLFLVRLYAVGGAKLIKLFECNLWRHELYLRNVGEKRLKIGEIYASTMRALYLNENWVPTKVCKLCSLNANETS